MNLQRLVAPVILLSLLVHSRSEAQFTVPDPAFATRLSLIVPAAMNGAVLDTLHPSVQALTYMNVSGAGIYDLSGVRFFTGLQTLLCTDNYLVSMPLLPDAIQDLQCRSNAISTFTNLPNSLVSLQCQENSITSFPVLPPSLERLWCYFNGLTALPTLPNSLTELACMYNMLTSLPALPPALEVLQCGNNSIAGTLGPFPATLERLSCESNQVAALSPLSSSLTLLSCAGNQLTSLPALPSGLLELDCDQNNLTALPALPVIMRMLSCTQNQLTALPTLPDSLVQLTCYNNQLAGLPALPAALEVLECPNNPIGVVPALPSGLVVLYASNNGLSSLPTLPNGLSTLFCFNNQLTSLPALPDSLSLLNCGQNLLTDLPALPAALQNLLCADNPIACLPILPNTLSGIVCNNTGVTCLPNVPAAYNFVSSNLGFPLTVCNVLSPCLFASEAITGSVFNDTNGNGVKEPGEAAFTNAVIEAQPGGFLTGPDAAGEYVLPMVAGTFTLDGQDVLYHTRTTTPANITLAPLQIDSLNDIGYQAIPGVHDLVVDLTTMPARPGFDNTVFLTVENIGTEPTVAAMALAFDATQTWVGSSIAPGTQTGSNATWSATIPVGGYWGTVVTLNTDAGVAIGTPLTHLFSATPSAQDTTPADNSTAWTGVVVGSYDPNDKQVLPQAMSPAQVQAGNMLDYTIRFQNTGTFPAERVVITDTLSTDLVWSSMELVSSSHATDWYIHQGVLHFVMDPINLPDSASDEPNSHGYVKFRMALLSTLLNGDQVENVANIHFDFNEPVITAPAVFTVDLSVGLAANTGDGFSAYPNPVDDLLNVQVNAAAALLELHAMDGRLLRTVELHGERTQLQLGDFASGSYLVSVVYGDGGRAVRHIVKQ